MAFAASSLSLLLILPLIGSTQLLSKSERVPSKVKIVGNSVEPLPETPGLTIVVSGPVRADHQATDRMLLVSAEDNSKPNIAGSQGKASISIGTNETKIISSTISSESLIFITPTTQTSDILYIESQGDGYVVIAQEEKAQSQINFNWFVDNTDIYNSIL